jgi:hypothetical protein
VKSTNCETHFVIFSVVFLIQIFSLALCSQTDSIYITSLRVSDQVSHPRDLNSSPGRVKNCNFCIVQTGSEVHPTSYPIGTACSFWGEGGGITGVKLATHFQLVPRSKKHGSIHPLPHTPSWHSAELVKHRDNFTLLFTFIFCYWQKILNQIVSNIP